MKESAAAICQPPLPQYRFFMVASTPSKRAAGGDVAGDLTMAKPANPIPTPSERMKSLFAIRPVLTKQGRSFYSFTLPRAASVASIGRASHS